MNNISHIQHANDSVESKIIQLHRNGDQQLTKMQVYREMFSYIHRFNHPHGWVSILLLYDLKTGVFWWRYFEVNYDTYFQLDIDTCLSALGYWEDENAEYHYYNDARHLGAYTFFSEDKIVKFYMDTKLDYIKSQGQYETFEQAYDNLLSNIKEMDTFPTPPKGEVPLNIDKHFFVRSPIPASQLVTKQEMDTTLEGKVPLYKHRKRSLFIQLPMLSLSPVAIELIDVKRYKAQWQIEIRGKDCRRERENSGKKTIVTVVLNDNYEIVDLFGEAFIKQSNPLYLTVNNEPYEILQLMHSGYTVQEISHYLGKDNKTISQLIHQMLEEGLVEKIGYGKYKPIVERA